MSRNSEAPTYQTTHPVAPTRRRQERGSVGNALRYCAGGTASLLATTCGGNELLGERHVKDAVHSPVHCSVHLNVATSLGEHRSCLGYDDVLARRQKTGLGWSDPVCTATELVALAPALCRGGNEVMPPSENEPGAKTAPPMWHPVTKVILMLCTSVFTDSRTRHAIQVLLSVGVGPKTSRKSSRVRTTKTGGSDPENFGLSRPKCRPGSLPPVVRTLQSQAKPPVTEPTKFACALS